MSPNYIFCIVLGVSIIGKTTSQNVADDDDYLPFYQTGVNTDFDWKLLKNLVGSSYKNVIISPISLKIVMALLYEGAGGLTEQEIQSVLNFSNNKTIVRQEYANLIASLQDYKKSGCGDTKYVEESGAYTLNLGTRIFLDAALQPVQSFQSKACEKYQTKIDSTNFTDTYASSNKINSWVEKLTFGKISKLVGPDDVRDAVLFITNAIFFKGLWKHEFPKNQSHNGGFYLSPSVVVQVNYMATSDKFYFIDSKELDAKLIRIPYKGKKYAMIIALPNAKTGLPQLIELMKVENLKNTINIMDKVSVDVVLPKFKFEFQARMSGVLKRMGLVSMFHDTASLAGITRGDNVKLVVSDIVQKAGIEINEEGSVAYAATNVQIGNKFGDAQHTFNVTHPFMFFIEDQITHTILFIGKVENPLDTDAIPLPSRFGGIEQNGEIANEQSFQNPNIQAAAAGEPQPPPFQLQPTWNEQDQILTKRFNYVDLELLREISLSSTDNVLISPASIKATLGMVLEGSLGICAEEISKTLRLPLNQQDSRNQLKPLLYDISEKNENSILEFANGIFVSNRLQIVDKYRKVIEEFYKGSIKTVNFANIDVVTKEINGWVYNATRGLIPGIVGPENLSSASTIVIVNALYFKGIWKTQFDEKNTKIKCFQLPNRQCHNVYMMQNTAYLNYATIVDIDAHALELPYSDDRYAMLILLPKVKNNIQALIRDLLHTSFSNIMDKLERMEVLCEIPRFDIDYTTNLVKPLQQLGIREIFTENANLSGIVSNMQVRIDNIMHKTKIQVNEKGTEAAAVTGAVVIPLMGSSVPRVIADHPFAFFIYRKDNRNILFEGIVNRPIEARQQPKAVPIYVPNYQQQVFPQYNQRPL